MNTVNKFNDLYVKINKKLNPYPIMKNRRIIVKTYQLFCDKIFDHEIKMRSQYFEIMTIFSWF